MAKETVKVDNGLEDIKLKDQAELTSKDKKNKTKKEKKVKEEKKKDRQGFFSSVTSEMKLVTWPSKKTVVKYSFASIVMIVAMAGFFLGMSALFDLLYGLVQGWIG